MLSFPNLTGISPNVTDLPYFPQQIQELENSLLNWIISLGVLDTKYYPGNFQELIPDIVSGVLVCDIVGRVLEKPIPGIFRSPKTENSAFSNLKRALTPLRIEKRMSQKYVWNEMEILNGNLGVILGLLEDLHRFHDGFIPRKRGKSYHNDGPYLGSSFLKSAPSFHTSKLNIHDSPSASPIYSPRFKSPRRLLSTEKSAISLYKSLYDLNEEIPLPEGFTWLHDLDIKIPETLNLDSENILEFRTGILICEILGKLERNKIEGVHFKVNSHAACRHNISKAFALLRNKPQFPSELYFCEDFVFLGDGKIIRRLLGEIYKIYRRTIRNYTSFSTHKLALN